MYPLVQSLDSLAAPIVLIGELCAALFPCDFIGKRLLMMFRGYIDESGNKELFTLSCLMASAEDWIAIESDWKKILDEKNAELRQAGRQEVSRFHTADCSSCKGDFKGWTVQEQIDFSTKLLDIFHKYVTAFVAFTFPTHDFKEVFPHCAENPYREMYGFLTKFIMLEMIELIEGGGNGPNLPVKFALFHDRNDHGTDMLAAFNHVMDEDPTFDKQRYFSSLTATGWESCVPLQAADLIAYEMFKGIDNMNAGRKPRKSLQNLRKSPNLGGHSKLFSRANLEKMRDGVEANRAIKQSETGDL